MTLEVICWKWHTPGYRSHFGPESVNVLASMLRRNLRVPYRFSCITDDGRGIDSGVRVVPIWDTFASVPNPSNARNPSCYRRLRMFSPEAAELIGDRIVSLDLDVVITADVTPLFDHEEEFKIWGGQSINPKGGLVYNWYNGSVMQLKAGTRTRVWSEFDPKTSPQKASAAGCRGSDQGWISFVLGKKEKVWGTQDGIYSYRVHVAANRGQLPSNARLVAFHGRHDPWMTEVKRAHSWVREHYQ